MTLALIMMFSLLSRHLCEAHKSTQHSVQVCQSKLNHPFTVSPTNHAAHCIQVQVILTAFSSRQNRSCNGRYHCPVMHFVVRAPVPQIRVLPLL